MVEHKNSTLKAKGSENLRKGLIVGDIKMIAEHFKLPYVSVSDVIRGRYFGDKDVVECAERIVAFYQQVDIENNVKQIIESYEPTNSN